MSLNIFFFNLLILVSFYHFTSSIFLGFSFAVTLSIFPFFTCTNLLIENGFSSSNLEEKVHISIGLIDNLCHEIVYHKHSNMDYDKMIEIVINTIIDLLSK